MNGSAGSARNDGLTVGMILDLWPSSQAVADDLGLNDSSHARAFRRRGKIPGWHWDRLLASAERRNLPLSKDAIKRAHDGIRIIGAPAWAAEQN